MSHPPSGNFSNLCFQIASRDEIHSKIVAASVNAMPADVRADGEAYVSFCLSRGERIEDLAAAYLGFTNVMKEEQLFFARFGHYRYRSLHEAEAAVYKNERYMKMYMRGLALTMYLWPQHQQIRALFQASLPRGNGGKYLEVGPGHGMFFLHALRAGGFDRCVGVDISETSVAFTRNLLESGHFGRFSNYEIVRADFLTYDARDKYRAIVVGEVLEHVEEPARFLRKMADLAQPGGFIFVSTCLNAAALDHIYNFETLDNLREMITGAGLRIVQCQPLPYTGKSLETCLKHRFPMNVVYLLTPVDKMS